VLYQQQIFALLCDKNTRAAKAGICINRANGKGTAVQCMQHAVGIKKFLRQWRVKTAEFSPVSVYSAVDKKKADDGTYSVL